LLALLLRWWGNGFGLPHIYTSDEAVTVNRAVRFGTGDLNPHWFNYGSLNMYFLFVNYGGFFICAKMTGLISGVSDFAKLFIADPTAFYLIGRAWSGIWSALTVLWVYALGKRWGGFALGWGAALFLAVNATTISNAHSILNDPLMIFLMTWAIWEIDGIRKTGKRAHYLRAGLAIGLAASTKYIPVLMFSALLVGHFQFHRKQWWTGGKKLLLAAIALSVIGFFLGTPFALFDYPTFLDYMHEWLMRGMRGLADPNYVPPNGWLIVPFEYMPTAMGWLAVGLAFIGIIITGLQRRAEFLPAGVFFCIWMILICSSRQLISRYPLPLYPLLSLWAAYAIIAVSRWLRQRGMKLLSLTVSVGLLLAALVPPTVMAIYQDVELTLPDTRTLMKEWMHHNIPPGTKVLQDSFGPQLAQVRVRLLEQYQHARDLGHAKAEKFRLQLLTLPPITYEWYWTKQPVAVALPRDQAWSDAVISYQPIDQGLDYLREQGFEYFVISGHVRDPFIDSWLATTYPDHAAFYAQVEAQGELLVRYAPAPGFARGPRLELYKVSE